MSDDEDFLVIGIALIDETFFTDLTDFDELFLDFALLFDFLEVLAGIKLLFCVQEIHVIKTLLAFSINYFIFRLLEGIWSYSSKVQVESGKLKLLFTTR